MDDSPTLAHITRRRKHLLGELRQRQNIIRDYARHVALEYGTGLYLYGRPGTGKTHTVRAVLAEVGLPYVYQRGHLTPIGLFELLRDHLDDVIVLDDVGAIFRSDAALQILLAALEPPLGRDRGRIVKYKRKGHDEQIVFRGGIIAISNRQLHEDDLLAAFKSRVAVLNFDPPDAQIRAMILALADMGWPIGDAQTVTPDECREVAACVIGAMIEMGERIDLRVFADKALPVFQQWRDDETDCDWQDLIRATIAERTSSTPHNEGRPSRASRKEQEQAIIREILQQYPTREEQVRAWRERTRKSDRAFYRRWVEVR